MWLKKWTKGNSYTRRCSCQEGIMFLEGKSPLANSHTAAVRVTAYNNSSGGTNTEMYQTHTNRTEVSCLNAHVLCCWPCSNWRCWKSHSWFLSQGMKSSCLRLLFSLIHVIPRQDWEKKGCNMWKTDCMTVNLMLHVLFRGNMRSHLAICYYTMMYLDSRVVQSYLFFTKLHETRTSSTFICFRDQTSSNSQHGSSHLQPEQISNQPKLRTPVWACSLLSFINLPYVLYSP